MDEITPGILVGDVAAGNVHLLLAQTDNVHL